MVDDDVVSHLASDVRGDVARLAIRSSVRLAHDDILRTVGAGAKTRMLDSV